VKVFAGLFGLLLGFGVSGGSVAFETPFAPQEGLVSRYETERHELCLNGRWQFQTVTDLTESQVAPAVGWDAVPIKIPSPWNVNAFEMHENVEGGDFRCFPSYPKSWETAQAAWMEKAFTVPSAWRGQRLSLHFGAVSGKLIVCVNGKRAGEGFDIFFAQEFDVTDLVRYGARNRVTVKVIAPRDYDQPGPYGRREYVAGSFWGSNIAGIWQDVFLEARPNISVDDVFVQPEVDRNRLVVQATIANHSTVDQRIQLGGAVRQWINEAKGSPEVRWRLAADSSLLLPTSTVVAKPGTTEQVELSVPVNDRLKFWSPNSPNLYGLLVTASDGGQAIDTKYQRFGWRQFAFQGNQLTLNGKAIRLKGDSWHFLGIPQMTRRYAWAWYRLLQDAGANAVRLHASVYPSFYHDMADEMGIMVLDESAIWLSDGGSKVDSENYWSNCQNHIRNLVLRDRNHPSVFGWSVENEMLPVLRNVWHAPRSLVDRSLQEVDRWAAICRTEDPTRAWISGDGEWDAEGRLPVISIHYGDEDSLKRAAASGKPWGVGETSMAYYGTPRQVSKASSRDANAAYASDEGRMNRLADESGELLAEQRRYHAAYSSVFNLVWYAVQPLPLGKPDLTKPISMDEGITFGPFREGVPGVQPERLGPYCTTLNPGYDPALPLYRPWPMFSEIKIVFTDQRITTTRFRREPPYERWRPSERRVELNYVASNGTKLASELAKTGAVIRPATGQTPARLLIDASGPLDECEVLISRVLASGGKVWIWNITPGSASRVSSLIGEEMKAEPRSASSFLWTRPSRLSAGITDDRLYFSENDDWRQMSFGLSGSGLRDATVVFRACPADWRKWNYQAEPVKTAALFRSEHEQTGSPVVFATKQVGDGTVIFCNFTPTIESVAKESLVESLFRNDDIDIKPMSAGAGAIDFGGRIVKALVGGSLPLEGNGYGDTLKVAPPAPVGGLSWKPQDANAEGEFDFKNMGLIGPMENSCAYLALWIKSSKPLNNLLAEPNLPRVSFTYGADDGDQIWLNGQRLANDQRVGPIDPNMFKIDALPLNLGWNLLVVKVVQIGGDWKFAGRFGCTDWNFLQSLEVRIVPPKD
jgi:beta-galactosidase